MNAGNHMTTNHVTASCPVAIDTASDGSNSMTEELHKELRNKGGRPRNPELVSDLATCLYAIGFELAKPPSRRDAGRLRNLHALRRSFEKIADREAQAERLRVKEQELDLRRSELPVRAAEAEAMITAKRTRRKRSKPKAQSIEPAQPAVDPSILQAVRDFGRE